jgi:hypothetical protein
MKLTGRSLNSLPWIAEKMYVAQIQQSTFRVLPNTGSIPEKIISFIKNENDRLDAINKNVTNMSPERVLQRRI